MKKILKSIIFILINLIITYNVDAISTTEATNYIDITKKGSITLNYHYDDLKFDNINLKIYHIASVTSDFQYQLNANFMDYPIKINGLKTNDEWDNLSDTLNAYIIADKVTETLALSNQNNIIKISNLTPGLYFVKTDTILHNNYTLLFDSFLISVPNLLENGTWDYDIEVYPKVEEYIPKYEKITYTVMKQWLDNEKTRPDSIDIEIYQDGVLMDNQILSFNNNWLYQWQVDDDGSEWTVIERNVPIGYNVSILKKNKNFIIINTNSNYKEENPKTLDNINLYLYLVIGAILGIILLTISLIRQKKSKR